jgi:hypothetical protein
MPAWGGGVADNDDASEDTSTDTEAADPTGEGESEAKPASPPSE